jgi:hypothetical protein
MESLSMPIAGKGASEELDGQNIARTSCIPGGQFPDLRNQMIRIKSVIRLILTALCAGMILAQTPAPSGRKPTPSPKDEAFAKMRKLRNDLPAYVDAIVKFVSDFPDSKSGDNTYRCMQKPRHPRQSVDWVTQAPLGPRDPDLLWRVNRAEIGILSPDLYI